MLLTHRGNPVESSIILFHQFCHNLKTLQPHPIDLMIGFRVLRQSKVWRAENHSLMRRTNCWVINSLDESLQAITKWRCLTVVISILFSVMIVFITQVSTNTKMCFFVLSTLLLERKGQDSVQLKYCASYDIVLCVHNLNESEPAPFSKKHLSSKLDFISNTTSSLFLYKSRREGCVSNSAWCLSQCIPYKFSDDRNF